MQAGAYSRNHCLPKAGDTGDTEAKAKQISRDLSLGFSSSHFLACAVGQTMGRPLLLLAGSRDSVGLEAELTQCLKSCLFENESLLLASDKQMLWSHTAM